MALSFQTRFVGVVLGVGQGLSYYVLQAVMFALRKVPHEATGFSTAELVYGRSLRLPIQMLRESWEG